MKTRYYMAAITLTVSMGISSVSYASPVDFTDNVSYTTDTLSGLDWLDVTLTANLSFDYVNAQLGAGGLYAGWRYATGSQFNAMVTNYVNAVPAITTTGTVYHAEGLIDTLITLLGDTYSHAIGFPSIRYSETIGFLADTYAPAPSRHWVALMIDDDSTIHFEDTTKAHAFVSDTDVPQVDTGHFLVRDTVSAVPIPAAAFMFAPALLGFMGLRRRAKNKA